MLVGGADRPAQEVDDATQLGNQPQDDDELAGPELKHAGRRRVLLVEDDASVLRATQRILARRNYIVECETNGPDALVRSDLGSIDVLLTDVMMPGGLTGPQLAAELQARNPRLRVVLMSGYSADALDSHATDSPTAVLQKPFSTEELVAAIEDAAASAVSGL